MSYFERKGRAARGGRGGGGGAAVAATLIYDSGKGDNVDIDLCSAETTKMWSALTSLRTTA